MNSRLKFVRPSASSFAKRSRQQTRAGFAALALAAFTATATTQAAMLYWDPTQTGPGTTTPSGGAGNWDLTSAFWFNPTASADQPWADTTGATDTAVFGGTAGVATLTANLGALGLVFQTTGYTIATATGPFTLTLGASGIDASALTSGTTAISAPVALAANQTWTVGAGATLTTSGVVSGSSSITKNGAGTLLINGAAAANTFTGGVTVNAGTLSLQGNTPGGTGSLTFANGTTFRLQQVSSSVSTFIGSNITVNTGATMAMISGLAGNGYSGLVTGDATSTFEISGTTQISFSLGANTQQFGNFLGTVLVDTGANLRFSSTSGVNNGGSSASFILSGTGVVTSRNTGTVNIGDITGTGSLVGAGVSGTTTFSIGGKNTSTTFAGTIVNGTGAAALTKVGTGMLTVTGTNTYTGATNVNAGTLIVNGTQTSATGAVAVAAGATLGGTGSLGGAVTVTGNITGGANGTVGTLTLASTAAFAATGNYIVDVAGATSDKLAITGALNLGNSTTDQITIVGTPNGTATYVLATYASVAGTFDVVNNLPAGYGLFYNATELDLAPVPEPGSFALLGGLLVGGVGLRQRRRLGGFISRKDRRA